jgi:hypothetical protein
MTTLTHQESMAETLKKLTDGLLFPSEDDKPIAPFALPHVRGELDETALASALSLAAGTPVDCDDGLGFFDDVIADQEWFTSDERERAERFRALVTFLTTLRGARVFRVGKGEIDVYALGRSPRGGWVGVKTALVET